ncbi:hypothetical protein GDO81_010840 [Engystomops pustulosus]|uniref:Uncharacterized protein n=1 Tax=Engystomops pustulosus TaxID=76066 RepID=A0AAV7C3T5_ENGPU|nr:hypothetical protein GDO81_010840 [Engystomops pustulosus]
MMELISGPLYVLYNSSLLHIFQNPNLSHELKPQGSLVQNPQELVLTVMRLLSQAHCHSHQQFVLRQKFVQLGLHHQQLPQSSHKSVLFHSPIYLLYG